MEMTPGDVVRRCFPVVVAGFVAAIGVGIWVGRSIDNAITSIGER